MAIALLSYLTTARWRMSYGYVSDRSFHISHWGSSLQKGEVSKHQDIVASGPCTYQSYLSFAGPFTLSCLDAASLRLAAS
jgi:hypothetical protein